MNDLICKPNGTTRQAFKAVVIAKNEQELLEEIGKAVKKLKE